ncbi:MAG: hypothetical protein ACKOC6_04120 [bacterium]
MSKGMQLAVELPAQLVGVAPADLQAVLEPVLTSKQRDILASIEGPFEDRLAHLLDRHAEALPLPGACIVLQAVTKDSSDDGDGTRVRASRVTWWDPLTVMTVFTKSSDVLWLSSKTPMLSRLETHRRMTLFVPQNHVAQVRRARYGRSPS